MGKNDEMVYQSLKMSFGAVVNEISVLASQKFRT
jgi:hypothetical protein